MMGLEVFEMEKMVVEFLLILLVEPPEQNVLTLECKFSEYIHANLSVLRQNYILVGHHAPVNSIPHVIDLSNIDNGLLNRGHRSEGNIQVFLDSDIGFVSEPRFF